MPPVPRTPAGLLRLRARPSARCAAPLCRPAPARSLASDDKEGDLGGPGGQQPPPPSPGGPQRNWIQIGGIALVAVAGLAYMNRTPEKKNLGDVNKDEMVRAVQDSAGKPLKETSGRKGELGGFRSE